MTNAQHDVQLRKNAYQLRRFKQDNRSIISYKIGGVNDACEKEIILSSS